MSQEKFLLFKRGLKSYLEIKVPDGHKMVCRDSGFQIRFSCASCSKFHLFIYRERLRNGGRYVLARKHRSSIHNESSGVDVTADEAAKGVVRAKHDENIFLKSSFHGFFFDRFKEFISL